MHGVVSVVGGVDYLKMLVERGIVRRLLLNINPILLVLLQELQAILTITLFVMPVRGYRMLLAPSAVNPRSSHHTATTLLMAIVALFFIRHSDGSTKNVA